MSKTDVEAGPQGPALAGSEDEALLQALRNVWPILSKNGRRQAANEANRINRER